VHNPSPEVIWDPTLATEAELRGEDIEGFLSGEHELCKKELLMTILHENGYDVEGARRSYDKVKNLSGDPTSKLSRKEARLFEAILRKENKDFSSVARQMKRKRNDCIVYYYGWKAVSSNYSKMKEDWKTEWCCVCDDGGDLIICDKCNLAYHPNCLTPPLTQIPKGAWYCPGCKGAKTGAGFSPTSPMASGKKARVDRRGKSKVNACRSNDDENKNGSDEKKIRKRLFGSAPPPVSLHGTDPCILGSNSSDMGLAEVEQP
jgi:hypothetical protein